MTRTPHPHPPAKARLLDAAQRLMLAQGFAATSVDDICRAAKLTKGSFFHYFDSKEALGRELLQRFCASGRQLHAACCGDERDPLQRVYRYIDGAIRLAQDPALSKGCLLGSFAQELCDTHPQIRAACAEGFEAWTRQFAGELRQARRRYAPRATFDPREVAEHFIAVLEGSLILGKARGDRRVVIQSLRHYKRYLEHLFEG